MEQLHINYGTLVVLSGLPGAGKSRLKQLATGLPDGAWVSTDDTRKQVLGTIEQLRDGRPYTAYREDANEAVFAITKSIVNARMEHGLTTVIDATSLTESDRKDWIDIAEKHGAPHLVLIVDTSVEQCIENMKQRANWVPEYRIREMNQPAAIPPSAEQIAAAARKGKVAQNTPPDGFTRHSQFVHRIISSDTRLQFEPHQLTSTKVDVIGDVHGLYADLLKLLAKAGWTLTDGHLVHADPERTLLFLGDLVDRGPDSIEVVELVKRAVEDGKARCVLGNHDWKLVKFVEQAEAGGVERWGSYANAETGMKLMALPKPRRDAIVRFLKFLPASVTHEGKKVAFVHGDIHRYDPASSLKGDMVYGQAGWKSEIDSDAIYQAGFAAGLNEYVVIRGHIPPTSAQPYIHSLERHAFQKGELMLLRFDGFIDDCRHGKSTQESFTANLLTQACDFDFDAYSAERFKLIRGLEGLVSSKLARKYFDPSKMLRGFKYSKEVFYKGSWSESHWLLKARGIVLDPSGAIVSHPFDKVFNFGEQGAGADLADETPILEVDKLNGFMGVVSKHPFKSGELLVHTQGSVDPEGEFTKYILDLMTPEMRGRMAAYLARNPMTLLFEVLHPSDPHIIEYGPDMMGLHLIGARGLGFNDKEKTEEEVDAIAAAIGLRRPKWSRTTWGELKVKAKDCRHEGWMVRADTEQQEFILKLKAPFYLTTKFLGRLSNKKAKHMFKSPHDFKKTVDEEIYPVVDAVTGRFTEAEFLEMSDEARVPIVRKLIAELL